ncbi:MAG TPA: recombination-associated protein RdgC [Xanthomonadaceae bacterium]|nr:recombination-associated protein RdgC [Xanthomonadaceae bacterium]
MFFRNLTLFRFPASAMPAVDALDAHLARRPLRPPGPLELSTHGFVSPFGRAEEALSLSVGASTLVSLGGADKLLPAAVVNQAMAEQLDAIAQRQGRRPGGRERRRVREEVMADLLPRAFSKPSRLDAYLDGKAGWLLIDTASRKAAENFVSALREALGSFPALPANPESSPRALMTGWLAGDPLPEDFALGDECELRDPADTRVVVKAQRHDLHGEELREHVKAGKQVFRLALVYAGRISFVLGEDLVVRKLRFLDAVTEQLDQEQPDSARAERDVTFALMSGELARVLARLETLLSIGRA